MGFKICRVQDLEIIFPTTEHQMHKKTEHELDIGFMYRFAGSIGVGIPKTMDTFGLAHHKDNSIWVSILGCPYLWKLPFVTVSVSGLIALCRSFL